MNIEEARKVLWLKSNPRPLGELLDEGYLTQERLEWAAMWAYNPRLKEAAKALLEKIIHPPADIETIEKPELLVINTNDSAIETNISFTKACSTLWPFSPYKGQMMGRLVESKQLSLKDLGYAIENAWDERVRQAATTFSLIRLKQVIQEPAPSAGFVHIESGGRSYAERRESWLTLLQGIITGWTILVFPGISWWLISTALKARSSDVPIQKILASPQQVVVIAFILILFIAVGLLIASIPDRISKSLDRQVEEHRLGQEGEDNVVQLIVQALDGNWHLFRNLTIPGRNKADLDIVLVGPPGLWVLEVKNYNGIYRNIGESWEYLKKKKWKKANKNPSRQAKSNSLRLMNFIKADSLKVYVNPVVVWANTMSRLEVENPSVAIWQYSRLADELGNIWQGEKLSQVERNKIAEKLTKLCQQQRKTA
jgi:hypothetical protein